MSWDDFARYYEWEFDLLCTEQARDVNEWLKLAGEFGEPILELACGAGRITLPLADQGYAITALDSSRKMLNRLQQKVKPFHKLKIVQADMRNFTLAARFRFIFISYASFQLLLTLEDQLQCLGRIRDYLLPGGVLGLDISTRVCEGPDSLEKTHVYTADYPAEEATVSMFESYRTDRLLQIRHWEDTYVKVDTKGIRDTYINQISIRECPPDYMKLLLSEAGFRIIRAYDYLNHSEITEQTGKILYLAKSV